MEHGGVYRWVTRSPAGRTGVLRASAALGLAGLVRFAVQVLALVLVLWEGARAFAGLWGWAALSVLIATEYWTLRRACRMQGWYLERKERQRFNWRTLVRRRRKPSSPSSPRPNDVPPES